MLRKNLLVLLLLALCACSTKQPGRKTHIPCLEAPVSPALLERPPKAELLAPGFWERTESAMVSQADLAAWFLAYAARTAWLEIRLDGWQEWYRGREKKRAGETE